MNSESSVHPDVKTALEHAFSARPDAVGNRIQTFRIEIQEDETSAINLISELVDHGWHLMGSHLIIAACEQRPKHLLASMVNLSSKPVLLRAELNLDGRFEARGEMRGEAHS